MKRKRQTYKRFKPILHEVVNGSKRDHLESHVEVRVGSRGRIGGYTTYRKGPVTSSPPISDTEEFSNATAPPSTSFDAALNINTPTSTNGVRPANVCVFQLYLPMRRYNVYRATHFVPGCHIVTSTLPSC